MDKPALEFITGAEPNTQECSKCHKIKSITEFRKDQHYCKDCQLTYAREYIKTIPKEKRQWYRRTEDIKGQNKRRSIKAQLLKVLDFHWLSSVVKLPYMQSVEVDPEGAAKSCVKKIHPLKGAHPSFCIFHTSATLRLCARFHFGILDKRHAGKIVFNP